MNSFRRLKSIGGIAAAMMALALAGCAVQTGAPGQATSAMRGGDASMGGKTVSMGDDVPAELAGFFPGAMLMKKTLPTVDEKVGRMGDAAGARFTGEESEWDVYEATQNGKRLGMAVRTHSMLPGGEMMRVAFAVDPMLRITKATLAEGPHKEGVTMFVHQMIGRGHANAFKVGQDLQAPSGVPEATAQSAADSVHKGLIMLQASFPSAMGGDKHDHPDASAKDAMPGGAMGGAKPPVGMDGMDKPGGGPMGDSMDMPMGMGMGMPMGDKKPGGGMGMPMGGDKPMADDMDMSMDAKKPSAGMGMPMGAGKPMAKGGMSPAENAMMKTMMGKMSAADRKTMMGMSMPERHLMMKMGMDKKPMGAPMEKKSVAPKPMGGMGDM